jgi:hypothetical protein
MRNPAEGKPRHIVRKLSSNSTLLAKYGVPASLALVLVMGPVMRLMLTGGSLPEQPEFPAVFPKLVGGLSVLIWSYALYLSYRIKEVILDGDHLIVSGWRRRLQIPLQQVESVEQVWWRPRSAELLLRRETEFGNRILFLPMQPAMLPWIPSPTVQELRELIVQASRRVVHRQSSDSSSAARSDYSLEWRYYFFWRRTFWLIVLIYFPGVVGLSYLLTPILGENIAVPTAWGLWVVALFLTLIKLRKWLCPRCRMPFFETRFGLPLPHLSVKSCRNCGLPKGAVAPPTAALSTD